jgi:hypothetical protein
VLPSVVAQALRAADLDPGAAEYDETHEHQFRVVFADAVADVARDAVGRRMSLVEISGRSWAAEQGVPVPGVLRHAADGAVLVSERCDRRPDVDLGWLDAVLDIAGTIASAAPPAAAGGSSWRAPRRTLPARLLRLVVSGVPLRAYLAARAAHGELPRDGVAHGDFHLGNVLSRSGRPVVVDWEFLGPAVPGTDALRLWATLPDAAHRRHVAARIAAGTPAARRAVTAVLARWVALHAFAEQADARRGLRAPAGLRRARQVWTELPGLVEMLTNHA